MDYENTPQVAVEESDLHGTWYLREAYAVSTEGQRLFDTYGSRPAGVIHYGKDQRMMALITHEGRPLLSGDRLAAPKAERAEAYRSSIGYAGEYRLEKGWITHHVDISTYPNWVGRPLRRKVQIQPDKSVALLTAPQMQDGLVTTIKLVWQRTLPT